MSGYDPVRQPEGGRTVPCDLCGRDVALSAENPRRVCPHCGNVNLSVPEAPPVSRWQRLHGFLRLRGRGGLVSVQPRTSGPARPPVRPRPRRSTAVGMVLLWGLVTVPVAPLAVAAGAVVALWLRSRPESASYALVAIITAGLALGGPVVTLAGMLPVLGGKTRAWRFLGVLIGGLVSVPLIGGVVILAGVGHFFLEGLSGSLRLGR